MNDFENMKNNYSKFLPAIFRGADGEGTVFFERFLKIFEKVLSGINDGVKVDNKEIAGISEIIDTSNHFFHPSTAPIDFIDWLSSWVGLVLKEDWSIEKKREVIAKIIPIYRMRGTKRGIEELLNIYIGKGVNINDNFTPFQVGINSQVGINTIIDLDFINYFVVEVTLSETEGSLEIKRKKRAIEELIDKEKPVHTNYKIIWKNVPSMQIGIRSKVGVNTFIWSYE